MKNSLVIGLLVVLLMGLLGSVYVVREDQTAMVLNLGKVVRSDIKPGLHFKVPLVETVRELIWLRSESVMIGARRALATLPSPPVAR
jgi:regulator of protease activity HflC (stomatin/prohibitin superfamily)